MLCILLTYVYDVHDACHVYYILYLIYYILCIVVYIIHISLMYIMYIIHKIPVTNWPLADLPPCIHPTNCPMHHNCDKSGCFT